MTLPPPGASKPIGLALAALLVGIGAFLSGLIPVFGALVGITAVVFGILALRKHQSRGMAVTGIVLGSVAAMVSVIITIGLGSVLNNASDTQPAPAQSAAAGPEATASADPVVAPQPVVTPKPVETQVAPAPPPAPAVPVEYRSALVKAASYSKLMHMSKVGIYDQLTSEYGEQFAPAAAQYAVDTLQADYGANALEKARTYQESMSMSPAAIRDQLVSAYGEKFTAAEADYAIANLNG